MRYQVIEAKVWRRDDGAQASSYGACPWVSEAERPRWTLVSVGWTLRNPASGQVGIGRPPCATRAEAQALADKLGTPVDFGA